MVGSTLSHYRILRKIGAGGMGEVYRAHDEQLDRDVALKVLPPGSFADENARARLLREARAAAGLNHPNICTVYEVGEAGGQAHIAMELIEGPCLSDRLQQEGLPPAAVLRYGMQIADALAHAHERRVIHRDLKTANVVITQDDRVKVLDFGLAKRLAGEELSEATTQSHAPLTQAGTMVGTLAYMAPEQLRGQAADARSDIWSLGVVLHEMAAGVRPFAGRTGFELCSAILNQAPARLPAKTPLELRALIERCLAKEPSQRYQRAGEVRAALETIHSGAAIPWRGLRYALGRRPWLAVAAIVAVLVVAVLALDLGGLRSRLTGVAATPRITTLAVLPVANLTGEEGQEYFAVGMTEELITEFSRIRAFSKVAPRTSVMRYRGPNRPSLREIAAELGVGAVVEASLLQSQGEVRATVRLIEAASERNLWAERYTRDLGQVPTLYSQVVSAVVGRLELPLTQEEKARLAATRTVNPEAYEAYLKGNFQILRLTQESTQIALGYFQTALEKDPNYALGHAGIATTWLSRGHMGFVPNREALPKAQVALARALELDDNHADVHFALASSKLYQEWDWPAAEQAFRKTIELNPNIPNAHLWYSDLLSVLGRREAALAELKRGLELDPLSAFVQASAGGRLLRLGLYNEAMELLQKAVATEPNLELAQRYLWYAHDQRQKVEDALTAAKKFFEIKGQSEVAEAMTRGYEEAGYSGAMRRAADRLGEISKQQYVQGTQIAGLYAYAGDKQRALDWLETAYEQRDSWLTFLKDDLRFLSLHGEPRFQALRQRMRIPQ
ncbi:MAG: protein kinase domain-containing protein [Candidatus Acidiferrales bacterium]